MKNLKLKVIFNGNKPEGTEDGEMKTYYKQHTSNRTPPEEKLGRGEVETTNVAEVYSSKYRSYQYDAGNLEEFLGFGINIDVKSKEDEIFFTVTAKSFLHSQVRIMVGTLIDV